MVLKDSMEHDYHGVLFFVLSAYQSESTRKQNVTIIGELSNDNVLLRIETNVLGGRGVIRYSIGKR